MGKFGASEKVVNIIRRMYVNTRAKYKLAVIETDWMHSKRGVRQGSQGDLTLLLSSSYTEELILRVNQTDLGMRVGNERLGILL